MKGGFSSESVTNIIRFACVSIISVILFGRIFVIITDTMQAVNSINEQINVVFPIILTMMAATGGGGSVAAYTPAVAILGGILTKIIVVFALPCFIISVVFDIVGNLSVTVRLKKLSGFFFSSLKWVMGSAFFVFLAFLSVKGITASIRDSVSIRTVKFAISNYIPIIGNYLSEGFNLVMAGSVLIKNAVGLSAMILLLVTVAPLIIDIMVFSLALSLLGAVVEPLGLSGVSNILSGIGKSLKSLVAIILGISFLYFVFLLLTICTGNLVL
jgi:stage III sporulation protein AE